MKLYSSFMGLAFILSIISMDMRACDKKTSLTHCYIDTPFGVLDGQKCVSGGTGAECGSVGAQCIAVR